MTERPKVGRPRKTREGSVDVCITIPRELREKLRRLGNSKWIVEQLTKAEDPKDK